MDNVLWIPTPHTSAGREINGAVILPGGVFESFSGMPSPVVNWTFHFVADDSGSNSPTELM